MKNIPLFVLTILFMATSANFAYSQAAKVTEKATSSLTSSIKVKGITCSKDLTMIADNVEKLEGVSSCEVAKQGATSTFNVTFSPALVTEEEIHKAIEGTGSCEDPNERPYKVKQ
jgi:copper chaperone CopZ